MMRQPDRAPLTRGQRGRRIGRGLIAWALVVGALIAFVLIAAPKPMGVDVASPWWATLLVIAGLAGYPIGLIWMIRIYRADAEPDQHTWRYREH